MAGTDGFSAAPSRCEMSRATSPHGTGSDTELEGRKKAEEEAKRIVDAIPQTIFVLDAEGTALTANRASLEYHGLTVQQIANKDARKLIFHPEDVERLNDERPDALARGVPFSLEWRARRHAPTDPGPLTPHQT